MKLEEIHGHTVDVERLQGGWVLDVGCRDFHFSREMVARGCKVVALDADPTVEDPKIKGVTFRNVALDVEVGLKRFAMHENPEARHLFTKGESHSSFAVVRTITIDQLTKAFGFSTWDCVKLDVEGAEYAILNTWPGPVAKQISIEFHEHCLGRQPDSVYEKIFDHLASWYTIARHERDARHCAGFNFWDSLLVSK